MTSIILGILAFSGMKYFVAPRLSKSSTTIGMTGKYKTENLPDDIKALMSRGLTKESESNLLESDIAENWASPDNGKTWVFHLKKDLRWNDGSPLNSGSINYDFSDVNIDKPDAYTIIFKLNSIFSPFPSVLTRPVFKKGLIGTGEWKVKKLILANDYIQSLTLTDKNSNMREFKFYPTDERTKLAFKLGEVDEITGLTDSEPFNGWNTANVVKKTNHHQIVTLFFNTQDKFMGDKSFRQALNYSIDKNKFGERALGPIPKTSFYFNPQTKTYDQSEERARELLKDFIKNNGQATLQLVTTTYLLPVAESIAKDWEKVGIKANVTASSLIPTDFQAYLTILETPVDPDQYTLWHSTQTDNNISKYSSPRIDKLLEDGRSNTDIEERKKIYLDFQRFINEDVPAIFIYYPEYYTILRKR